MILITWLSDWPTTSEAWNPTRSILLRDHNEDKSSGERQGKEVYDGWLEQRGTKSAYKGYVDGAE